MLQWMKVLAIKAEFNTWDSNGGRRELIPKSYTLTSTCLLWYKCAHTFMDTLRGINQ